jgi:hypothetical protein
MVLATAMFLGRVGIISVLCGFASGKPDTPLKNAISRLVQPCYGVFGVIIGAV